MTILEPDPGLGDYYRAEVEWRVVSHLREPATVRLVPPDGLAAALRAAPWATTLEAAIGDEWEADLIRDMAKGPME